MSSTEKPSKYDWIEGVIAGEISHMCKEWPPQGRVVWRELQTKAGGSVDLAVCDHCGMTQPAGARQQAIMEREIYVEH